MSRDQSSWQAAGVLDSMVDPRAHQARRALARLHYPVAESEDLPADVDGIELLEQVLREEDYPLQSLRQALGVLELRLRDRQLELPDLGEVSTTPDDLAGEDPASRAARLLYRALRRRAQDHGMSRFAARRAAHLEAAEFLGLCRRWLPVDAYQGPAGTAALHAWAECYAREYRDAGEPCAPSAACDEAARMALHLAGRITGS